MPKIIAFDMDGTIADLYSVPGWLEMLNAHDPAPYINAAPMWDMDALREVLLDMVAAGWEVRVISWLAMNTTPEYSAAVRKAKREWLDKYNFPADKIHLVAYGTTKADAIRRTQNPAVLVDDNAKVRNGWTLGETIDPMATDDLPGLLREMYLTPEG